MVVSKVICSSVYLSVIKKATGILGSPGSLENHFYIVASSVSICKSHLGTTHSCPGKPSHLLARSCLLAASSAPGGPHFDALYDNSLSTTATGIVKTSPFINICVSPSPGASKPPLTPGLFAEPLRGEALCQGLGTSGR